VVVAVTGSSPHETSTAAINPIQQEYERTGMRVFRVIVRTAPGVVALVDVSITPTRRSLSLGPASLGLEVHDHRRARLDRPRRDALSDRDPGPGRTQLDVGLLGLG
jgi:hypothetical protein